MTTPLSGTSTSTRTRRKRTRLRIERLEARDVPQASAFQVTNLLSDHAGIGQVIDANRPQVRTDGNLVNPWGLAVSPTGGFWVANNGTNTATTYTGDVNGTGLAIDPRFVRLPGGAPTGEAFNGTNDFIISDGASSGKATLLFATEAGEIVAWRPGVASGSRSLQGQITATVPGAVFKGLAIAQSGGNNFIYAADFRNGEIDVFNRVFKPVQLGGSFTDPTLPTGYAPFNIMAINDKLYVTYALRDVSGTEEVPGPGNGIVDVFSTDGQFERRLVDHGLLNAPWGMAIAPTGFGKLGGALLVGNFGNGEINAYSFKTGQFLGTLRDDAGTSIKIDGLWGMAFGNGSVAGDSQALYFTAGVDDETHGVFGSIRSVPPPLASDAIEAVGADAGGGPHVKVFDTHTGQLRFSLMAYNLAFHGGVRVAVGDVNGDGTLDIVTAAGVGGGPHIKVFDGTDGHLIREFMAYAQDFRGGLNVAVGDVNGDGFGDIITGADAGGGPHVKVFSGADGSVLQSFMAYDLAFRGGVRVAAGDINSDGLADVITGPGVGGGPHVKVFNAVDDTLLQSFIAFSSAFRGGIFVAAGDVSGDGVADIVVGAGVGMGPQVAVFNPINRLIRQSFAAYDASFDGGVRVAVRDANDDGVSDFITGAGPGGGPHVRIFNGITQEDLGQFMAFDPAFHGGVFVG